MHQTAWSDGQKKYIKEKEICKVWVQKKGTACQ